VAVGRLARELRTISAAEGLSPTESGVLAILDRSGAMRAGDLAEAEAINPTLLSRVVGRLEDADLVARERDPEDREPEPVAPEGIQFVTQCRPERPLRFCAHH
jgi:DNA-binding MarR family transcriptional regulator